METLQKRAHRNQEPNFCRECQSSIAYERRRAVALAAWLQTVWEKEWAVGMLWFQLWGMTMFAGGVFCAGLASFSRFLAFYHRNTNYPYKNPFWWCHVVAFTFSIFCFAIATILIVRGGFVALNERVVVIQSAPPAKAPLSIPPATR